MISKEPLFRKLNIFILMSFLAFSHFATAANDLSNASSASAVSSASTPAPNIRSTQKPHSAQNSIPAHTSAPNFPQNPNLDNVFNSFDPPGAPVPARIRLIFNNEDAWYARWNILNQAKKSIVCTYFIVDKDVFGMSFLGLLRKKAQEGVKIRLMIDDRFFAQERKFMDYDELDEIARFPNVEIKMYNSIPKVIFDRIRDWENVMVSDHDKIIIIDGNLSMTGGRNIGRNYFIQYGEDPNVFADMDVVIQGKNLADRLLMAFEEEWGCIRNSTIKPDLVNLVDQSDNLDLAYRVMNRYLLGAGVEDPTKLNVSDSFKKILQKYNSEIVKYKKLSSYSSFQLFQGEREKPIKILDKNSKFGPRDDIRNNLLKLFDAAKNEILIQNAYVVLEDDIWAGLKRASDRGVKIVINTNSGESTNHESTVAFFMNDWKKILTDMKNARILVFPKGERCLHTKAFAIDRQVAVIGTYNLDPLSAVVNSEEMAVINDRPFATRTALHMCEDFKRCLEYKIEIDRDNNIKVIFGPEEHTSTEIMKKLNFLRKIQWIRPLI
ncbi:MAG: phosphatidylserine/phosphatidylglycerophosphate/cardiolipin synthase family protein [Candidatus Riflebacteria bacterium]|nr:phosphatidylserine/phosphatidylglycerophosphate/cardiolipin synthase family protein [Candidatus Riflebacteria bacterium]